MGLDLSVYTNVKLLKSSEDSTEDDGHYHDSSIYLYKNDSVFNQSDDMEDGFYEGDRAEVSRLGWGYSGYNTWRKFLVEFAGYRDIEDIGERYNKIKRSEKIDEVFDTEIISTQLKFAEVCYFTDCEGFIGPKTSAKLYNDFESNLIDYTKKAMKELGVMQGENFVDKYKKLMEHFKIASENNGVVKFC